MNKLINVKGLSCAFAMLSSLFICTAANASQDLEFSGFGRVVGGAISDKYLSFNGYDNNLSFEQQSLIALRADYTFTDDMSFVGQVIGHSADNRNSGIQWLYLNYQATSNWSLKLGRQRIPLFNYSDVIDVGFAYPWISPPTQVYTSYVFSEFEGLSSRYDFINNSLSGAVTTYYGVFDGDIYVSNDRRKADVKYIAGVAVEASWSGFDFSAAYHQGEVAVNNPELEPFINSLRQLGFNNSALALEIDGEASFAKLGLAYETFDYYFRTEWTRIDSNVHFVPKVSAAYASVGYHLSNVLLHVTYATSDAEYNEFPDEIPIGIDPQLDALAFGYQQVVNSLPVDSLDSFTVGARYDYSTNIAFKAELSFLNAEEGERGFFDEIPNDSGDLQSTLYQLAIEWVF
jgi:hypothetical protein